MTRITQTYPQGPLRWGYWPGFCLLLAILLSPLLVDTVPPLLDYPIHLARSYIAIEYPNDPVLRGIYDISWRPIPNLSGDIILLFLGQIFDIEIAGRILLAFCLAVTVAGVFVLQRVAFGSWSYWAFLAFLPAMHGALTAGFINYSIGVALLPFALSISIWLRNSGTTAVIVADMMAALVLLFCHVVVVGIYGIYLLVIEFCSFVDKNNGNSLLISLKCSALRLITPFILPSIIYFSYSLIEVVSRPKFVSFGHWKFSDKIRSLFMPVISGDILIDCLALAVIIAASFYMIVKKALIVRYDILLGSIFLLFLSLLLPGEMLDAAFIADRLPIAAFLVALASCRPAHSDRRFSAILLCSVFFVVAVRASNLRDDWQESSHYYGRLAQALETIERGSSVLIVSPLTDVRGRGGKFWWELRSRRPRWQFALFNIPTLHALSAVLLTRRSAFTQLHFVWSDKQILSLSTAFRWLDYGDGGTSTWAPRSIFLARNDGSLKLSAMVEPFDYILIVYADLLQADLREGIAALTPAYADDDIVLLKTLSSSSWRSRRLSVSGDQTPVHLETQQDEPRAMATTSCNHLSCLVQSSR